MTTSLDEIRKALRDIHISLEPLVVGDPRYSEIVIEVRYKLALLGQYLDGEISSWNTAATRVSEWRAAQDKKKGKK
jgi:hypothetical protein